MNIFFLHPENAAGAEGVGLQAVDGQVVQGPVRFVLRPGPGRFRFDELQGWVVLGELQLNCQERFRVGVVNRLRAEGSGGRWRAAGAGRGGRLERRGQLRVPVIGGAGFHGFKMLRWFDWP